MDANELRSAIDTIINLKDGETLDSFTGEVQNKSYWSTSFYRTLYGDSRKRLCNYLDGVINQLLAVMTSDKISKEIYMDKLNDIQRGLLTLITTYSDDEITTNIQKLIEKIKIYTLRQTQDKKVVSIKPKETKMLTCELEERLNQRKKNKLTYI